MRRPLPLLTALVVAAALLCVTHLSPATAAPGTWLSRINGFRAQNGLGPLTEDVGLNMVAQSWTQRMASNTTPRSSGAWPPSAAASRSWPWRPRRRATGWCARTARRPRTATPRPPDRSAHRQPEWVSPDRARTVCSGRRERSSGSASWSFGRLAPSLPAITSSRAATRTKLCRRGPAWRRARPARGSARAGPPVQGSSSVSRRFAAS